MAMYRYMAHDDPAPPVARSIADRITACGYAGAGWGENIAYGYRNRPGRRQRLARFARPSREHRAARLPRDRHRRCRRVERRRLLGADLRHLDGRLAAASASSPASASAARAAAAPARRRAAGLAPEDSLRSSRPPARAAVARPAGTACGSPLPAALPRGGAFSRPAASGDVPRSRRSPPRARARLRVLARLRPVCAGRATQVTRPVPVGHGEHHRLPAAGAPLVLSRRALTGST